MTVTADKPAPYAPASAIMNLVERHRGKGLPSPVDADVLARAGISDSLIPRTLQALQTLDLIDESGAPSEVLEGIRLAPEAEYQQRLAEWLNAVYADALAFVDPATDAETQIRDAFRSYKPVGQQSRMVSLFRGLFTAAGVMPERQRQATPRKPRTPGSPRAQAPKAAGATSSPQGERKPPPPPIYIPSGMPPALAGLMANLPMESGGWTSEERERFMSTFGAVLDFCFPITVKSGPTNTATDQ